MSLIVIIMYIFHSYSNIFVTSPSPDNLHTMFEFIFKGFDALQYQVVGFMPVVFMYGLMYGVQYIT